MNNPRESWKKYEPLRVRMSSTGWPNMAAATLKSTAVGAFIATHAK
jgi:hypothetical protein